MTDLFWIMVGAVLLALLAYAINQLPSLQYKIRLGWLVCTIVGLACLTAGIQNREVIGSLFAKTDNVGGRGGSSTPAPSASLATSTAPAASGSASSASASTSLPASPTIAAPPAVTAKPAAVDVSLGGTATIDYRVTGSMSGRTLGLQRQQGTGREWKHESAVIGSGVRISFKPAMAGVQALRVVIADSSGEVLSSSKPFNIRVFTKVPLAELLSVSTLRTKVISKRSFKYAYAPNIDSFMYTSEGATLWSQESSHCRSITLLAASSTSQGFAVFPSQSDKVSVQQESADERSISVPPNSIRSMTVKLEVGKSWAISMSGSYYLFLNGSAECYDVQPPGN